MERRQNNDDKKRLARRHSSDLLRSLTREQIGGGQHVVVSQALRASPSFHVLRVRHLMRTRTLQSIPAVDYNSSSIAQLQTTQWLHAIQDYEESEVKHLHLPYTILELR